MPLPRLGSVDLRGRDCSVSRPVILIAFTQIAGFSAKLRAVAANPVSLLPSLARVPLGTNSGEEINLDLTIADVWRSAHRTVSLLNRVHRLSETSAIIPAWQTGILEAATLGKKTR